MQYVYIITSVAIDLCTVSVNSAVSHNDLSTKVLLRMLVFISNVTN